MTKPGSSEEVLYQNIVSIPHYHTKYLTILDKEDEVEVVNDNFEKFQEMYQPIWKSTFKDSFSLENGKFDIEHD